MRCRLSTTSASGQKAALQGAAGDGGNAMRAGGGALSSGEKSKALRTRCGGLSRTPCTSSRPANTQLHAAVLARAAHQQRRLCPSLTAPGRMRRRRRRRRAQWAAAAGPSAAPAGGAGRRGSAAPAAAGRRRRARTVEGKDWRGREEGGRVSWLARQLETRVSTPPSPSACSPRD